MNTKHLYIYSNFDFSKKSAGKTRMLYYAKALADNNQKVYLVSCSSSEIVLDNFNEIEPNIFILNNSKLTQSLYGTIIFLRNLEKFSKKQKGERSFLFYPSPLVYLELFSLIYLKYKKKLPVFYELNEVRKYSSSFHDKLSIKKIIYSSKKIIYLTVFNLLERLLKFYNGLICISTSIEKYGLKYNKNIIRIPILTDPNYDLKSSSIIYKSEKHFNIGFSGSIKPSKENLELFFKVLSNLIKDNFNITLNLCGPISDKDYNYIFKELLIKHNISEKVKYFGNLDEQELSSFLSQQDLLVIPRGYTLQNKYGFSTKLSDYLNHKKMILITDISDNKNYIKDGINGFIVPPDDCILMEKKIKYIINKRSNFELEITQNAYLTSKKYFSYKLYKNKLQNFLK